MRFITFLSIVTSFLMLSACGDSSSNNNPPAADIQSDAGTSEDSSSDTAIDSSSSDTSRSPEAEASYYEVCPCDDETQGYQGFSEAKEAIGDCTCGAFEGLDIPDLSGKWAHYMVQTSSVKMPIFGDVSDTEVRSLLLFDIEQDGASLSMTVDTCSIEMVSEDAIVETIMPDVFVAALATGTRPGVLVPSGEAFALHASPFYELRGVTLENPETDTLPTEADDPTVLDQDEDGFPGMTIRLKGAISGDLYIVQRSWTQIYSTSIANDRIEGLVMWDEEQNHLGSTNEVLRSIAVESWVKDDAEAHTFEMVRASDASCESIVENKSALFGL